MRKRVALFANGWSFEYIQKVGNGLLKVAKEKNIDLFSFISYTARDGAKAYNDNEHSIFTLPDIADFDGVILLTNSFNLDIELQELQEAIHKYHIPAVSLEGKLEGMDYIGVDNYSGMYELAEHLFDKHQVKNVVVMAGIQGHEESEKRLKAVMDAAGKYGVEIMEDNIFYANWAADNANLAMEKWLEEHDSLPDAVVCANDTMAIGIFDYLKKAGYRVPDDCIVTGFDGLVKGQQKEKVLTTVNHSWDKIGQRSLELLIEKMQGRKECVEEIIKTRFLCGESCGCQVQNKIYVREDPIDGFISDQHFRHMYGDAKEISTIEQLNKQMSTFFLREHAIEGNKFVLCLNTNFLEKEGESLLPQDHFEDDIEIACALYNGTVRKRMKMKNKKSIFRVAEESSEAHNYIFVPLCGESKVYGYGMLTRDFDICFNNVLYIWTRHVSMCLRQIRTNAKMAELTSKLERLSVTDGLTGVYNRNGLEQNVIPFLERVHEDGKKNMVFIADIDRMKTINDSQGHAIGDQAIKIVAEILTKSIPQNFSIVRYGGDEFVFMGEYREGMDIDKIKEDIQRKKEEVCRENQISYNLGISIGGTISDPEKSFDLTYLLQQADENMYIEKELHHFEQDKCKV